MKLATASITSLILLLVSAGSVVLALPDEEGSPSTLRSHLLKTLDIKTSSSNNRRRFLMIPGFLPIRAANRGKGSIRTNGQISKIGASKIAYARAGARFGVSRRSSKYAPPRNSEANHSSSVPKIGGMAVEDDGPLDDSAVPTDKPTVDSATSIAIAFAAYNRVHLPLIEDERPRRRENVGMIGRRTRSSTKSNSRDEPLLPRHLLKPNRLAGKFIDDRDAIEGSSRRR